MPDAITIPLGPQAVAALLAFLALTALAIWSGLLSALLPGRLPVWWELAGAPVRAILGLIAAGWALLLVLALVAVIAGVLRMIADPEAGGFGLAALMVALLGAPFLIWGTVIRQTTLDYQLEGHITDRIAKAVEQLGTEKTVKVVAEDGTTAERSEPNIEVRLGAILSLERIAQDSTRLDQGRDHVRVMEILCAYIRENSNAWRPRSFPLPEWEPLNDDATVEESDAHIAWRRARFGGVVFGGALVQPNLREWAQTLPEPRADVQLALDVIGRRSADQRAVEAAWPDPPGAGAEWVFDRPFKRLPERPLRHGLTKEELATFKAGLDAWTEELRAYCGYRPNLRGANLQRADMSKGCFSGMRLEGARMEGANLSWAQMKGAALWGVRIEGARLFEAQMEGARLVEARMEGAILSRARMEGADLREARMEGAAFDFARMAGADLEAARMEQANLCFAGMEGVDLDRAQMQGADLRAASMEGANLAFALMEGANLTFARLMCAKLSGAGLDTDTQFFNACFQGAAIYDISLPQDVLSTEQIAVMFGDGSVTLPGIAPGGKGWPAHWPVRKLDLRASYDEWHKWQADPEGYRPPE